MITVTMEPGQHITLPDHMDITTDIKLLSLNPDGTATIGISSPDLGEDRVLN